MNTMKSTLLFFYLIAACTHMYAALPQSKTHLKETQEQSHDAGPHAQALLREIVSAKELFKKYAGKEFREQRIEAAARVQKLFLQQSHYLKSQGNAYRNMAINHITEINKQRMSGNKNCHVDQSSMDYMRECLERAAFYTTQAHYAWLESEKWQEQQRKIQKAPTKQFENAGEQKNRKSKNKKKPA